MHDDLERLIRLQRLDTFADQARRTMASLPDRVRALDERLANAQATLDSATQRLAASSTARRDAERDLAAAQGRLSKYRDQLMEVKTNREYQAMQKEIEVAQREVRALEDRILECLLEADVLSAAVKAAEAALEADRAAIADDRAKAEAEARALEADLTVRSDERASLAREIDRHLLATYDLLTAKRGVAVAEARQERCTACHVRLRPQVFYEIRRGDAIFQCDSCHRILYFVPEPAPPTPADPA